MGHLDHFKVGQLVRCAMPSRYGTSPIFSEDARGVENLHELRQWPHNARGIVLEPQRQPGGFRIKVLTVAGVGWVFDGYVEVVE